jgi:hypothetical protein
MFLCEKCHPKKCNCWGISRSLGPCESCRKTAVCFDCHGSAPLATKKTKKKAASKRA